jgi:hypothetical protein
MVRGIRNNNPGNVRISRANAWIGKKVPNTDGEFEQFDEMWQGVRAMSHILQNYAARGLTNVADIVSTWSLTDQAEYIANVSEALNVDSFADLDLNDFATRFDLVRAMIRQEVGAIPAATISDETIERGLNS